MHKLFGASMKAVVILSLTVHGCKAANFGGDGRSRHQSAASQESLPVQTELTAEDKELQARLDHQKEELKAAEVKALAISGALDVMSKVSDLVESMPKSDEELKANLDYQKSLATTAATIISGVSQIEKVAMVVGANGEETETTKKLALIGNEKRESALQLQSQGQSPTEMLSQAAGAVNSLLRNEAACGGVVESTRSEEAVDHTLSVKTVQKLLQRLVFGFDNVMKSCLAKVAAPTDCKIHHEM
ncbi:MAG: hypothetical protein RL011_935 [Pseudomonadota bacterium]|jgi:hypothetical protein